MDILCGTQKPRLIMVSFDRIFIWPGAIIIIAIILILKRFGL